MYDGSTLSSWILEDPDGRSLAILTDCSLTSQHDRRLVLRSFEAAKFSLLGRAGNFVPTLRTSSLTRYRYAPLDNLRVEWSHFSTSNPLFLGSAIRLERGLERIASKRCFQPSRRFDRSLVTDCKSLRMGASVRCRTSGPRSPLH